MSSDLATTLEIRDLSSLDADRVIDIDALHTGERKAFYWHGVLSEVLSSDALHKRVGLAAVSEGDLVGYLLGEVRAFEFGSEECGWIFAIGVEPALGRTGVASDLLDEALRRFKNLGIRTVRTMVQRTDVPVLSFFRSSGFVGGSFYQLELDIGDQE
jgi:ribosomal protein S18 acetylase RimI-like enzyme